VIEKAEEAGPAEDAEKAVLAVKSQHPHPCPHITQLNLWMSPEAKVPNVIEFSPYRQFHRAGIRVFRVLGGGIDSSARGGGGRHGA